MPQAHLGVPAAQAVVMRAARCVGDADVAIAALALPKDCHVNACAVLVQPGVQEHLAERFGVRVRPQYPPRLPELHAVETEHMLITCLHFHSLCP